MAVHTITKGLELPITGAPKQAVSEASSPPSVAIVALDFVGMKPKMLVAVGDTVKRGQPLLQDKKTPSVNYTSPAAGTVTAINRGAKRLLHSVVIDVGAGESAEDHVSFDSFTGKNAREISRDEIRTLLLESGMWTALRVRPFSKVADPDAPFPSLFVTAMDTNPHAPDPDVVLEGREEDFATGLTCLAKLTEETVYLCTGLGAQFPGEHIPNVQVEQFVGPHPAGTAGLHMHLLKPVHAQRQNFYIDYQDVMAVGHLFSTGKLDLSRVISLAGPSVMNPRLLRTRLGASTDTLTAGELTDGEHRTISGSVLSGRTAQGLELGYLGRYHHQVSVIKEGHHRELFGWMMPGMEKFSVIPAFLSRLLKGKQFALDTSANGGARSMVPIGLYERVFPLDILPTFLLRSLVVGDIEESEKLGCLELDEEDLALCTFVCPCKIDYGPALREVLTLIEKEG